MFVTNGWILFLVIVSFIRTSYSDNFAGLDGNVVTGVRGGNVTLKWNFDKFNNDSTILIYKEKRANLFLDVRMNQNFVKLRMMTNTVGFCSFAPKPGSCRIEISDLTYADEGGYFVYIFNTNMPHEIKILKLIVQDDVRKCGNEFLPKYHTSNYGDAITGDLTLCGNPRPIVTWYIGNKVIQGEEVENKNIKYEYTHSFRLPATPDLCGKNVTYKAVGLNNVVKGTSRLFLTNYLVKNIDFRRTEKCPSVTWVVEKDGLCDVDIVLTFIQKDNSTKTIAMPVLNEVFRNCEYTSNAIAVIYQTNLVIYEKGNKLPFHGNKTASKLKLREMKAKQQKTSQSSATQVTHTSSEFGGIVVAILISGILIAVLLIKFAGRARKTSMVSNWTKRLEERKKFCFRSPVKTQEKGKKEKSEDVVANNYTNLPKNKQNETKEKDVYTSLSPDFQQSDETYEEIVRSHTKTSIVSKSKKADSNTNNSINMTTFHTTKREDNGRSENETNQNAIYEINDGTEQNVQNYECISR